MKVRPWPHYDVILRHEFVVIALARDLSEPVTHLVSLHAHWSLLDRSVTNAQPHHLRFALRRWAASSVNGCSLATSRHLSSRICCKFVRRVRDGEEGRLTAGGGGGGGLGEGERIQSRGVTGRGVL